MRFSGFVLSLPALLALSALALASGCSVYGPSLLGSTGGAGGGGSSTSSGSTVTGAGGGPGVCMMPGDCPGQDTACGTRTCQDGMCGVDAKMMGTPVTPDPTKGDCKKPVCDGSGDTTTAADPTDVPNDNNQCTIDACNGDKPSFTNQADGFACTQMGGKKCKAGQCVACVTGTDCSSGVCTNQNTCAPTSCMDMALNGNESDVDCGGSCSKCINGKKCNGAADCVSGSCAVTCQPSCSDGVMNQDESDVDCGGSCGPCNVGQGCATANDCVSGACGGTTCSEYQLLISEARFHGPNGGTDDFVEIYNAAPGRAVLTSDITLASKTLGGASFNDKWPDATVTFPINLPSHGHYLMAGGGYAGAAAADFKLAAGTGLVADKAAVVLKDKTTVLDALCIYCGTGTFDATYQCEGTPINMTGCTSSTLDRSEERKPGGAAGNATDTNDNTADFSLISPANPQNLQSAPTP